MNFWLQSNGPSLIQQWCQQHAEPLLSTYLEQWMLMNSTQLLTQIQSRQSMQQESHWQQQQQQMQQQIQHLQTQVQQLQQQLQQSHPLGSTPSSSPPVPSVPIPKHTSPISPSASHVVPPFSPPQQTTRISTSPTFSMNQHDHIMQGVGLPFSSSVASGLPSVLDARALVRNRIANQSNTNTATSLLAPSTSSLVAGIHRPLGLGFNRTSHLELFPSPIASLAQTIQQSPTQQINNANSTNAMPFPPTKGPIADLLSSAETALAPGEEVSTPSHIHSTSPYAPMRTVAQLSSLTNLTDLPMIREQSSSGSLSSNIGGPAVISSRRSVGAPKNDSSDKLSHVDILIVEDVRVAQRIASAALTRAHYKVDIASSGEQALEKFRALQTIGCPKIILMDITLPGMSGVETTKRIRKIENDTNAAAIASGSICAHPSVLIYGLTGNVDPEDLLRYRGAGMNGCIVKGRLLAESVRIAVEENERSPLAFVNLAERHSTQPSSSTTPPPLSHTLSTSALSMPGTPLVAQANSTSMVLSPVPIMQLANTESFTTASVGITSTSPATVQQQAVASSTNAAMEVSGGSSAPNSPLPLVASTRHPIVNVIASSSYSSNTGYRSSSSPSPHDFSMLSVGATTPTAQSNNDATAAANNMQPATSATPPSPSHVSSGSTSTPSSANASPLPLQTFALNPRKLGLGGVVHPPPTLPATTGVKRSLSAMQDSPTTGDFSGVAGMSTPSTPGTPQTPSGAFDVLLVEDVRVAQRIAARALQSAGYRVDVASSGEAAVERFKLHQDSLRIILMDINLPGMSGTDATEIIRHIEREREILRARIMVQFQQQVHDANLSSSSAGGVGNPSSFLSPAPRKSPVLVFGLTGNTDEANLRLYEAAGMNGCIAKGTALGHAVRQAIELFQKNPSQFVNLAGSSTTIPTSANVAQANLNAALLSPMSTNSTQGDSPLPVQLRFPSVPPISASALSTSSTTVLPPNPAAPTDPNPTFSSSSHTTSTFSSLLSPSTDSSPSTTSSTSMSSASAAESNEESIRKKPKLSHESSGDSME